MSFGAGEVAGAGRFTPRVAPCGSRSESDSEQKTISCSGSFLPLPFPSEITVEGGVPHVGAITGGFKASGGDTDPSFG